MADDTEKLKSDKPRLLGHESIAKESIAKNDRDLNRQFGRLDESLIVRMEAPEPWPEPPDEPNPDLKSPPRQKK